MFLDIKVIVYIYIFVKRDIRYMSFIRYMIYIYIYTAPNRIMEKKRFNLQAPPVYDRKVTNLFFPIIIVSIFFSYNSVGECMSIDSQFECILRGNIEL